MRALIQFQLVRRCAALALLFNDGLKQLLRLKFQEFEDMRSGESLSLLQKVRADCERFINAFINTLFASLVGVSFLVWDSVTKHWLLVPVFLVGVLVMGGLTGLLSREIKSQQRAITRETNRNSGSITESLRNIELIMSLGLTFPEIRRLHAQIETIFALETTKVKRIRLLSFLQGTTLSVLKLSIRLSTIMHADTIFVLEKGSIVEQGTHADLLERRGLYYAMWRQQAGERPSLVQHESSL